MTNLDERIEKAGTEIVAAFGPRMVRLTKAGERVIGIQILRAAFPELFTSPPTHKIVPIEPNDLMIEIGSDAMANVAPDFIVNAVWRAMIEASRIEASP